MTVGSMIDVHGRRFSARSTPVATPRRAVPDVGHSVPALYLPACRPAVEHLAPRGLCRTELVVAEEGFDQLPVDP